MAIGTGTALLAGAGLSAGASIIGGNKAADAQADAARQAQDTQLQMFETQREDFAPWLGAGENALAALSYELGLGPMPTRDMSGVQDARDMKIRRVGGGGGSGGGGGGGLPGVGDPGFYGLPARIREMIASGNVDMAEREFTGGGGVGGGSSGGGFRVGGETFDTRREARDWKQDQIATARDDAGFDYRGFEATPSYDFRLSEGLGAIDRSAAARGGLFSGATAKASQRFGEGLAAQEYGNYLARLGNMAGIGMQTTNALAGLGSQTASNVANAQMSAGQARASGYANMANSVNSGISNAFGGLAYSGAFGGGGGGGYGMSNIYAPNAGLSLP